MTTVLAGRRSRAPSRTPIRRCGGPMRKSQASARSWARRRLLPHRYAISWRRKSALASVMRPSAATCGCCGRSASFSDVRVEATSALRGVDVAFVVTPQPLARNRQVITGSGRQTPEVRRLRDARRLTPRADAGVLRMSKGHRALVSPRRAPRCSRRCPPRWSRSVVSHRSLARVSLIDAIQSCAGRTAVDERVLIERDRQPKKKRRSIASEVSTMQGRIGHRSIAHQRPSTYDRGYANAQVDPAILSRRGDWQTIEFRSTRARSSRSAIPESSARCASSTR